MITLQDVQKYYGKGESRCHALKGVTLSVPEGSFLVLLGASGSGKSTLLNIASGLERADAGSVCYDGENLSLLSEEELTKFRRRQVGFIFQQYYLLPHLNVEKNVKMGADLAGNRDYQEILDAVGLLEKRKKYPSQLSGGEQQRVAVARALAKKPKVLFLDEPTGALDEATGRMVLDYIARLQRDRRFTMIMVTHNQNIADMADMVIRMNSGKVLETYENQERKSAYEIGW